MDEQGKEQYPHVSLGTELESVNLEATSKPLPPEQVLEHVIPELKSWLSQVAEKHGTHPCVGLEQYLCYKKKAGHVRASPQFTVALPLRDVPRLLSFTKLGDTLGDDGEQQLREYELRKYDPEYAGLAMLSARLLKLAVKGARIGSRSRDV